MSEDNYGKVTFYWNNANFDESKPASKDNLKVLEFPTPATLKDTAERLMHILNQKSVSGQKLVDYCTTYLIKFRKVIKTAGYELPDYARIKVETETSSMDATINDYELFVLNCNLIEYVSTSKADDVEDNELPVIAPIAEVEIPAKPE